MAIAPPQSHGKAAAEGRRSPEVTMKHSLFSATLRRGLAIVVGLALLLAGQAAQAIESTARQAYLVDFQTGTVLYDKAGEEKMHPSSMSKLMTIYLVFERLKAGKIKLTDLLTVSEKAWRMQGSKMFTPLGSQISVEDLLRGIIIQSGNDACIVMAEGLAGSEEAFVDLENKKAKELGLTGSHFANATGWPDPEHYMTARDLAILARHLIQDFPEYYHYFSEETFVFHGIKQGNRNPLLYKDFGADGLKTGHTEDAGFGLTASVKRDNRRIIMVLNGLNSMQDRADEGRRMMDWAFRETENVQVAKAGERLEDAPVWMGQSPTVPLALPGDYVVTLPRGAKDGLQAKAVFDGPVAAPIAAGQKLGKLLITGPDMPPIELPLVAGADVPRLGPFGRAFVALRHLVLGSS
jgi:D-alanyl-D-alanine carboxypeptidase (penicillin-binding protein 5/6)